MLSANQIAWFLNELFLHSKLSRSGLWNLKFTVSLRINWFFAYWYKFMQIKGTLKILAVGVVKNGCGQSWDGTLKLTLFEEWTNGINWFFACWCRFIRIKSSSKMYWVGMVKNGCDQSGHGTLKLTLSQNWTDEITWFFSMLVQMQEGWKLIHSFLSGPCQKWQCFFSSWDPKTCILRMNTWIELLILMLIVMQ